MSHFEYEKPSAVEISERELDEIAAVLSSGSVPLTKFDEEIRKGAGYPANTIGDNLGLLSSLICNQFSNKSYQYQAWLFFRVIGGFSYKDKVLGLFLMTMNRHLGERFQHKSNSSLLKHLVCQKRTIGICVFL